MAGSAEDLIEVIEGLQRLAEKEVRLIGLLAKQVVALEKRVNVLEGRLARLDHPTRGAKMRWGVLDKHS